MYFSFSLILKQNTLMAFPHQHLKHPQSITDFTKPTGPQR